MNRDEALKMLRGGSAWIQEWNRRRANDYEIIDLSGANLEGADLGYARLGATHLAGANLQRAYLRNAYLGAVNLSGADLTSADLSCAHLGLTDLRGADLSGADLSGADLSRANIGRANLKGACLQEAMLVETNLERANLDGCSVYGVSVWELRLEGASQSNLVISPEGEPTITVDNLEVAQFIYLLLHSEKLCDVINTITSKVVLILGRFTPERKPVLDAIREELRTRDYCPLMFDFQTPATRDTHETVTTLARLARFVIADMTDPRSIPQELVSIVETLPSVPVQPLLEQGSQPWGMYDHIKRYPWVLAVYQYGSLPGLVASIGEKVIAPAEAKARQLESR